eukprot:scaffold25981_cov54-Phaeocystis_antarctica.AAC.3
MHGTQPAGAGYGAVRVPLALQRDGWVACQCPHACSFGCCAALPTERGSPEEGATPAEEASRGEGQPEAEPGSLAEGGSPV